MTESTVLKGEKGGEEPHARTAKAEAQQQTKKRQSRDVNESPFFELEPNQTSKSRT